MTEGFVSFAEQLRKQLDTLKLQLINSKEELSQSQEKMVSLKLEHKTEVQRLEEALATSKRTCEKKLLDQKAHFSTSAEKMKSAMQRGLQQLESMRSELTEAGSVIEKERARYTRLENSMTATIKREVQLAVKRIKIQLKAEHETAKQRLKEEATRKVEPILQKAMDDIRERHREETADMEARHGEALDRLRNQLVREHEAAAAGMRQDMDRAREQSVGREQARLTEELRDRTTRHEQAMRVAEARHEAEVGRVRDGAREDAERAGVYWQDLLDREREAHATELGRLKANMDRNVDGERAKIKAAMDKTRAGYAAQAEQYRAELVERFEAAARETEGRVRSEMEGIREEWLKLAIGPLVEYFREKEQQRKTEFDIEVRALRQTIKTERERHVDSLNQLKADFGEELAAMDGQKASMRAAREASVEAELRLDEKNAELAQCRRLLRDARAEASHAREEAGRAAADAEERVGAVGREAEVQRTRLDHRVAELEAQLAAAVECQREAAASAGGEWRTRAERAEAEAARYKEDLLALQDQVASIEATMGALVG